MDIRKLLYFCAIVDHGSISGAAKFLNITQPPLSVALKELEEELGKKLIVRKGRSVSPTVDGQLLYGKAVKLLKTIDEFEFSIRNEDAVRERKIRIGVASPADWFVRELIHEKDFIELNAGIELFVSSIYQVEKALQERKVDFAILREPLSYSNYTMAKLGTYHHVAVYSAGFDAPAKPEITVQDLDGVSLILPRAWGDRTTVFNDFMRKQFYNAGIVPRVVLETDQHAVMLSFLLQDTRTVSFLPNFYRNKKELSVLQFRDISPVLPFEFLLIRRSDVFLDDVAMEVMDRIKRISIDSL